MRIFSEKTNKEYATVAECVKAEKEYDEAIAAKKEAEEKALAETKAKNEKIATERKEAAQKVEDARKKMIEASKAYREELAAFCDKYNSYHMTYRLKPGTDLRDYIDDFFFPFWF